MGDESQALTCYIVKPTRIYDLLKITSIVMRHTVGRYLQGRVSMETVMEPFSIHLLLLLPLLCLSVCVCCMCRYVSDFSSDWLWTTSFGSLSPPPSNAFHWFDIGQYISRRLYTQRRDRAAKKNRMNSFFFFDRTNCHRRGKSFGSLLGGMYKGSVLNCRT